MEPKSFVVIYGLPGAGKTSLCKWLADSGEFFYANLGEDPRFGQGMSMWRLALDLYETNGGGKAFITEGVLGTRENRDRFAENIWRKINGRKGLTFAAPVFFLLKESLATLNQRRPSRSVDAYQELEDKLEIGSDKFQHFVLDVEQNPGLDDFDARGNYILLKLREEMERTGRGQ
jgi:hypothetical protein